MSLQTRFAVLFTLLAATTAMILATALSFGRFLERELVKPFERITSTLRCIEELEKASSDLTSLIAAARADDSASRPGESVRSHYAQAADAVFIAHQRLDANPNWRSSVGAGAADALDARLAEARRLADEWSARGDADAARRAGQAQREVHLLVEAIERRLVGDAPTALAYGADLSRIHRTMTFSGIVAAALFVVLCVLLFRRWVIHPIRALRRAALSIGRGEFQHRIQARSDDELGVLSREVDRMAGLVEAMQADAVEKERLVATGEMVRRLAHNIRNPLAAIRGLAELSNRRAAGDEALRANQAQIIESIDRFNNWLSDLLSVTTPKGINPLRMPVRDWLAGVVDSHRPLAQMRGVELVFDFHGPDTADFDPRHLEHAVVAILTNAIQASPQAAEVRVSTHVGDGLWDIDVSDAGGGVPVELREKVFRPYYTTKRDGTGIGLAIAREVARGHGGDVTVHDAPGGGAVFRVRLPIGFVQPRQMVETSQTADNSP